MKERRNQIAGTLSGGEQQMVAMGRALMARPKLLCMDEPSMGLSPIYVEQVFDIIQEINRQGTTIFMVEQNANMALSIAHRAYVLQTGQVVLSGHRRGAAAESADPRGVSGRDAGGVSGNRAAKGLGSSWLYSPYIYRRQTLVSSSPARSCTDRPRQPSSVIGSARDIQSRSIPSTASAVLRPSTIASISLL